MNDTEKKTAILKSFCAAGNYDLAIEDLIGIEADLLVSIIENITPLPV